MSINTSGTQWSWENVPPGMGILAVRNKTTSKSYYVGVSDLRQRAYDHHRLLHLGIHHNKALQEDFDANPAAFEIVAVEQVHCQRMLPIFKQVWIERNGVCYNRKNAIRRKAYCVGSKCRST